jgi:hypothetical protein
VQVFARQEEVPLGAIAVEISGEMDPGNPVRDDVSVFSRVEIAFSMEGVSGDQAERLVTRFKGR